jgi:hypothetical protein
MSILGNIISIALVAAGMVAIWRTPRQHSRRSLFIGFALLLIGAAVARAPAVDDHLPYLSYIDEGHILHRAQDMIDEKTWDPQWYRYPSLTMDLTALGAEAYSALPGAQATGSVAFTGGEAGEDYYDLGLPPAVVVIGRVGVLILSIATVAAIGVTALLLAGRPAAAAAAGSAAVLPALVVYSAIVSVHAPAAFFVAGSAVAAAYLVTRRSSFIAAALGGLCAAMAFTSMYVAGAALALVLVAIFGIDETWRRRIALLTVALGSWVTGVIITMPAFLLKWSSVWADVRVQADIYASRVSDTSYIDALTHFDELGWPFVVLAIGGLVLLAKQRSLRAFAIGVSLFLAVFLGFLARYSFQPLQSLLPVYPVVLVLAGVAISGLSDVVGNAVGRRVGTLVAAAILAPLLLIVRPTIKDPGEDSRTLVVSWLTRHVEMGPVVVAQELTILPSVLADLPYRVSAVPLAAVPETAHRLKASHIVVPVMSEGNGGAFETVAQFGDRPTPEEPNFWRHNDERIYIQRALAKRITMSG